MGGGATMNVAGPAARRPRRQARRAASPAAAPARARPVGSGTGLTAIVPVEYRLLVSHRSSAARAGRVSLEKVPLSVPQSSRSELSPACGTNPSSSVT